MLCAKVTSVDGAIVKNKPQNFLLLYENRVTFRNTL